MTATASPLRRFAKTAITIASVVGVVSLAAAPDLAQAASPLCASSGNRQDIEWVSRLKVNATEFAVPKVGYHDTSSTSAGTLQAGQTYPIAVDVHTNGGTYSEYVKVWLDLDQNGEIDAASEIVYSENATFATFRTYSGTFMVPSTAYNGTMYGRMIMQFDASPNLCGTYTYGATVDFVVTIQGGVVNPGTALDPEVIGMMNAQADVSRRMASAQIDNFYDRLVRLHEPKGSRNEFDVNLGISGVGSVNSEMLLGYAPTRSDGKQMAAAEQARALATGVADGEGAPDDTPDYSEPFAIWSNGTLELGTRSDGALDLSYTAAALSAGADYRFSDSFVAGFGVGYGRDRTDVGSNGTNNVTNAYSGVVYASLEAIDNLFVDGLFGAGVLDIDSTRYVSSSAFALGDRNGRQMFGSLIATYEVELDNTRLAAYGGVEASRTWLDGFTETGGGASNMIYAGQTVDAASAVIGARIAQAMPQAWGTVTPGLRVEYARRLTGASKVDIGFANAGSYAFNTQSNGDLLDTFSLGASVNFDFDSGMALDLDYMGSYAGSRNASHRVSGRLAQSF